MDPVAGRVKELQWAIGINVPKFNLAAKLDYCRAYVCDTSIQFQYWFASNIWPRMTQVGSQNSSTFDGNDLRRQSWSWTHSTECRFQWNHSRGSRAGDIESFDAFKENFVVIPHNHMIKINWKKNIFQSKWCWVGILYYSTMMGLKLDKNREKPTGFILRRFKPPGFVQGLRRNSTRSM